jgi:hypothetical protein
MRMLALTTMFLLAACASRSTGREVAAVVQDEGARQAATAAAREGEGSKAALEAGAQAADHDKDVSEPPI